MKYYFEIFNNFKKYLEWICFLKIKEFSFNYYFNLPYYINIFEKFVLKEAFIS